MRIRESGCDSSIVLSKFKFNCDELDKSIPDPLPQNLNHFFIDSWKTGQFQDDITDEYDMQAGEDVQQEIRPDIFI